MTRCLAYWLEGRDRFNFYQAVSDTIVKDKEKTVLTISQILYMAANHGDQEVLRILTESGKDYAVQTDASLYSAGKVIRDGQQHKFHNILTYHADCDTICGAQCSD